MISVASLAQEKAERSWARLSDHISKWFYKPDLDALRISLAAAISHYSLTDDPVWLYIIGVPGSGKTSVNVECLSILNHCRILSDLTVPALISGYHTSDKHKPYGLLYEIGKSGIFCFKDFTTILTKRHEDRDAILGALREIYDGRYSRQFGTSKHTEAKWEGKLTVIAAVTPVIESMWAVNNKMGDRFVQVRLPRVDGVETARFARKQIGHKTEIKEQMRELTKQFINSSANRFCPAATPLIEGQMDALAECVAWLRCHVDRDQKDRIMYAGQPEMPTRLIQGFTQIARAHASLFHRDIDESDVKLARRVAIDTIPLTRLKLFQSIPDGTDISRPDVVRLTGLANSTVGWIAEELKALRILKGVLDDTETRYSFTDEFAELKQKAGLTYG